ncbi:A disintegrin and metalloproteinase with thrombospondin motifs 7-like [Sitophilus oryzae]|uniref:A disintegrin and metalloproteinase with thrombospondin motifs 7-like n=1 Tax=Sitophilus oryzae TaxID=7048 RepID=A0A6J2XRA2_SITOR|nr:A disintegrin and metalloproteinase with thrombospondin motifs 7-like [Sitophilus oryzae]
MFQLIVCLVSVFTLSASRERLVMHGRYTRSINNYHLSIPHKVNLDGEFSTFSLPHFYEHNVELYNKRKKRELLDNTEIIYYGMPIEEKLYYIELEPNRDFMHPNLVFEKRNPIIPIKDRDTRGIETMKLCHYKGKVKGIPKSRVALSTCDGLAGYVMIDDKKYYIEPVDQHGANSKGQHLHVVYESHPDADKMKCGTESPWIPPSEENQQIMEKRELESKEKYLEVLVVCDKSFLKYHKHREVELYVMTIMNMVSDGFHDGSVGYEVDVTVVRIIYLEREEKEIDLEINKNAESTLNSFAKWAEKINAPIDSPNHHDMAVLLTRYDLCGEGDDCGLTGLANVGKACDKNGYAGCINEDAGLPLAVIVTHELGHLLGSDHDESENPCPAKDTDNSYFIMSPYVHLFTIRWSSCSRKDISKFFDANKGTCLEDEPSSTMYPYTNKMPGVVYGEEEQCKFIFPASPGACHPRKVQFCENLLCKTEDATQCMGMNDEGPADGTKCGENKWCFRRKCVEMGGRPEAVNGGWGEWQAWSDCSRTCGGGIAVQERLCNNPEPANKGRYCIGERKRLKICNFQSCPEDAPSFRQTQCTAKNSDPYNGQLLVWTAVWISSLPCALVCSNPQVGKVVLSNVAKDGSICNPGTRDICIKGICTPVGCDHKLNSDAIEDRCGICNGDGTQCKFVEGTFENEIGRLNSAKTVVTIPAGARKIRVEEKSESENCLAVADVDQKHFFLNKGGMTSSQGEHKIAGSKAFYRRMGEDQDQLLINGPIKEDIVILYLYYQSENVGVDYSWVEGEVDTNYEPKYSWEIGQYSSCSARCGGGTQEADWICVEEKAGKVSPNFCNGIDKPAREADVKNCNENPCETRSLESREDVGESPELADVTKFWKDIWSNNINHRENAPWICVQEQKLRGNLMNPVTVTTDDVRKVISKLANSKAPGKDGIQTFGSKDLPVHTHVWHHNLTESYKNQRNFQVSSQVELPTFSRNPRIPKTRRNTDRSPVYLHCIKFFLLALVCKEQITIDAVILEQARQSQRNVCMAYVDYQKAFDSIPHSWLLKVLEIYSIDKTIINFLQHTMAKWNTSLSIKHQESNIESGIIRLQRGIFQGDSLSALWFCLALNPISETLKETGFGFTLKFGKNSEVISHLLFMDDLKIYAANQKQLDAAICHHHDTDIAMDFGVKKCQKVTVERRKLIEGPELQLNPNTKSCGKVDNNLTTLNLNADNHGHLSVKNREQSLREWGSKALHGRFYNELQRETVDKQASVQWLVDGYLFPETEGFMISIQDQVTATLSYRKFIMEENITSVSWRKCKIESETIEHILSGCQLLAGTKYVERHDRVATIVYLELLKNYSFEVETSTRYYQYKPAPVVENTRARVYWNKGIIADKTIPHNKPDITVIDKQHNNAFLIDISIPNNHNMDRKHREKVEKYTELKREIKDMWRLNEVKIVPIILTSMGLIPINLKNSLEDIGIQYKTYRKMQKSVILDATNIVRSFLE